MSAAAAARRRAQKRDPIRGSQIAPSHPMPPVVCGREGCGDARLIHEGRCLRVGCSCVEYVEAEG